MTEILYGDLFSNIFYALKAQTNLVYVYYLLYLGVFNHAGPLCLLNCLKGRSIDRTCCDWSD